MISTYRGNLMTEVAPLKRVKRKLFDYFVSERESIRLKRERGLHSPWTKDPVLMKYHFTNIDRRHDTGTKWMIHMVDNLSQSIENIVFNLMVYRAINNMKTAGYIHPLSFDAFDRRSYLKTLRQVEVENKGRVFSVAHQNCPFPGGRPTNWAKGRDVIENYADVASYQAKWVRKNANHLVSSEKMTDAISLLINDGKMGPLTAGQTVLDLALIREELDEVRVRFSLSDFIPVTQGSKLGLQALFGERKTWAEYDDLFLKFQPTTGLTFAQCEHALCEFSKYVRLQDGIGKKRLYRSEL